MEQILGFADIQRSRLLGLFLANESLRRIFQSRAARLFVSFVVSCIFSAAFSLYFLPLALLLAPLIYGVPHLWASLRYTAYATGLRERRGLVRTACVGIVGSAFGVALLAMGFRRLDSLAPITLAFFAFAWLGLVKSGRWKLGALLLLAPLFYRAPFATAAVLLFAHNLVAYVFWIHSAHRSRERWSAGLSFAFLLAVCALIAAGVFDRALLLFPSNINFPREIWIASEKVLSLLGLENSLHNVLRWLAIFSTTQTMHYFVWLKALAEQNLPGENPASFARTFKKLRDDYGRVFTYAIAATCLAAWGFALVNSLGARYLYSYVSAVHAFWEIAAIPLLITWKRRA